MRKHPAETKESDPWFDSGDLFYRKEDKLPFDRAFSAISSEEKSLVVVGDEGVLDHYCRMLISRLKNNENFHLEVFLSTSKDGLLKRFNQMLANMSIDEARRPATESMKVHLLVINDASSVKEEEWGLLIRLIRDFPGANVRVALFLEKAAMIDFESKLEKFGRRVHKWTVHAPTLDEAAKLRDVAEANGYSSEAEKMLRLAGLEQATNTIETADESNPRVDSIAESTVREEKDDLISLTKKEEELSEKIEALIDENQETDDRDRQRGMLRPLALTLILSISLVILFLENPHSVINGIGFWVKTKEAVESYFSDNSRDTKALTTEDDASLNSNIPNAIRRILVNNVSTESVGIKIEFAKPTVFYKKTENDDSESIDIIFPNMYLASQEREYSLEPFSSGKLLLSTSDENTKLSVNVDKANGYDTAIRRDDGALIVEITRKPMTEASDIKQPEFMGSNAPLLANDLDSSVEEIGDRDNPGELEDETATPLSTPVVNVQDPVTVVNNALDETVFIQHIVFSDRSQALDFSLSYGAALQDALLLPIRSGNRELVAVVSGPFESEENARQWIKDNDLPADFWIRGAGLLKQAVVIK